MNLNFIPRSDTPYKYNYVQIFTDVANGELDRKNAYRMLILDDLFFVLFFIVKPFHPSREYQANHPFVVSACRVVEDGPRTYTLDIWAREHFKSSILTIAETIQYIARNPEESNALFSYARPAAKKFLFNLKQIFENEELLPFAFPEVFYQNPQKESPLWSLDEGLVLKRKTNRREPTVGAYGLIEGMPTGGHYDRRIYDDVVTEDIKDSPDVIEKVKDKFDVSQNLGTIEGTHRVIGTYYHHTDPLTYVRDKKHPVTQESLYLTRIVSATENGEANGKPVLLTQERLDVLKADRSFNAQQLCNPTPRGSIKLNRSYVKFIPAAHVPHNLHRFMTVDPAGDARDRTSNDAWAIELWGIEPQKRGTQGQTLGAPNRYLLDAVIEPMRDSEAIDAIVRMYMRGGFILRLGIEKVGLSSVEVHVANALKEHGRHLTIESGSLVILRPSGRTKGDRIIKSLEWHLNNSKFHISDAVPSVYAERLLTEMDRFPFWHDDGLDAAAYLDDLTKDLQFSLMFGEAENNEDVVLEVV